MGELTNQIAIVIGVLTACFAGPGAALFVMIRRKAKARQSRRSPIGIALLRGPGHSLREQLDETHNDLTWDLVLLMVVPLLALALFLAQSHLRGLPQTAHLAPIYALAAITFIAYMLRKRLKAGTRLDHLKSGLRCRSGRRPGTRPADAPGCRDLQRPADNRPLRYNPQSRAEAWPRRPAPGRPTRASPQATPLP